MDEYDRIMCFLAYMVGRVGGGYHPDTKISEYVNVDGCPVFTPEECIRLQSLQDRAHEFFDNLIYSHSVQMFTLFLED